MGTGSRISGFYKMSIEERREAIMKASNLSDNDLHALDLDNSLRDMFNHMIENVVGIYPMGLGIATNFVVNGKEVLVPMATEEASVVAAASNAARMARKYGGFTALSTAPEMIAQIQVEDVIDPYNARIKILQHRDELISFANSKDPLLVKLGGGARDVQVRILDGFSGKILVIHLIVNCLDAMGANAVNTMAETLSPRIQEITGGRVFLRILTNLADRRLVRVRATFDKEDLGGSDVVDGIIKAWGFAAVDPYRAATHRKGIMNGISAVALATGNDTRAIEAGVHSYAFTTGDKLAITFYEKDSDGNLVGTIEVPMPVGTVGGATRIHPTAQFSLKLMGIERATELGEIIASVGLAQNLAALRALASEGIQRGHMTLHAKNIAASVGAKGDLIQKVAERMVSESKISMGNAEKILKEIS